MKKTIILLLILTATILTTQAQQMKEDTVAQFEFNPNIDRIREFAKIIPGEFPKQINVEKVAETIRPANIVVEGNDANSKMTLSRTVYQVVYDNGTIMLDSGMDIDTHKTFGKTEEPYFQAKFDSVVKALNQANLIILTHYHADHVAGVIRASNFEDLAKKTWITESTANLLINKPHKPTVKITKESVEKFLIAKDQKYMPIAPGIVLFMAPGHTPDSKMIYIALADGREYIHSIDSGWSMENIRKEKLKNASWVNEDKDQLITQYKWLNQLEKKDKDIIVLCTHDNIQYDQFTKNGTLGKGLKIQ